MLEHNLLHSVHRMFVQNMPYQLIFAIVPYYVKRNQKLKIEMSFAILFDLFKNLKKLIPKHLVLVLRSIFIKLKMPQHLKAF